MSRTGQTEYAGLDQMQNYESEAESTVPSQSMIPRTVEDFEMRRFLSQVMNFKTLRRLGFTLFFCCMVDYFVFHLGEFWFLLTLPYLACHAKKYNSAANG